MGIFFVFTFIFILYRAPISFTRTSSSRHCNSVFIQRHSVALLIIVLVNPSLSEQDIVGELFSSSSLFVDTAAGEAPGTTLWLSLSWSGEVKRLFFLFSSQPVNVASPRGLLASVVFIHNLLLVLVVVQVVQEDDWQKRANVSLFRSSFVWLVSFLVGILVLPAPCRSPVQSVFPRVAGGATGGGCDLCHCCLRQTKTPFKGQSIEWSDGNRIAENWP